MEALSDIENVVKNVDQTTHIHSENTEKQPSGLTVHLETSKTPEEIRAEKRLVMKIDLLILPMLALSLFLASLDRGDTGYAYTAGMGKELRMTAQQLSASLSMFYIGYIIMQLPATLYLKMVTARVQLSAALMAWGLFTTLLCLAHSWQVIAGLRILIGCGESFLQAAGLYLTFFYKRNELATRGSIYYAMFAIAGSANGLLSYAILKDLNDVNGWLAWRWIFLIEGLMSVAYGFFIFVALPASPEKLGRMFNAAEKEICLRRYREAFNVEGESKVRGEQILGVLKDPMAWFYTIIYGTSNVSLAAFGNFLPVLLTSFGFTPIKTNLLTIPIWAFTAVFIIVTGIISDRIKKRGVVLLVCFSVAAIGYIILLARPSKWVKFGASFLVGAGTYPQVTILQSWMNSNMIGYTRRATTLALLLMVGQCFSIASTQNYSDPPYYSRGNGFALSWLIVGGILTGIFMWFLARKNAAKVLAQGSEDAAAKRGMSIEEIQDRHPDFMYYL